MKFAESDDTNFIAMEFVDGVTLRAFVESSLRNQELAETTGEADSN
jgi:tRNA A-37 threonylcarbamoyl transferase component Bud32